MILIVTLLVCGCSDKDTKNNDNENKNGADTITKEQVFKEKAIEIYGNYQLTKEYIGYYVTPLKTILNTVEGHDLLFKDCDVNDTHIAYEIREESDGIKSVLRLIFKCNGKTETYFYEGLYDEEPVIY